MPKCLLPNYGKLRFKSKRPKPEEKAIENSEAPLSPCRQNELHSTKVTPLTKKKKQQRERGTLRRSKRIAAVMKEKLSQTRVIEENKPVSKVEGTTIDIANLPESFQKTFETLTAFLEAEQEVEEEVDYDDDDEIEWLYSDDEITIVEEINMKEVRK